MKLDAWADGETLPNGIYVRRKTYWSDCEIKSWPQDNPWLATISVGGWHYSSRGSNTKEQAVIDLVKYMHEQMEAQKDLLKIQENRIKELADYLILNSFSSESKASTMPV